MTPHPTHISDWKWVRVTAPRQHPGWGEWVWGGGWGEGASCRHGRGTNLYSHVRTGWVSGSDASSDPVHAGLAGDGGDPPPKPLEAQTQRRSAHQRLTSTSWVVLALLHLRAAGLSRREQQ